MANQRAIDILVIRFCDFIHWIGESALATLHEGSINHDEINGLVKSEIFKKIKRD